METIITTESPPGPVPVRRRRGRLVAVAAASVLVAGAGGYALGATLNGGSSPASTVRADTRAWAAGPGFRAMTAVRSDAEQIQADAEAYDLVSTESDGSQLSADATRAASMPPPTGTGEYILAMTYYAMAGQAL